MANGWQVTGQRDSEDLVNGRFVPVMVVSVLTDSGTPMTFRIPVTRYSGPAVEALVTEWYERHQAVANL